MRRRRLARPSRSTSASSSDDAVLEHLAADEPDGPVAVPPAPPDARRRRSRSRARPLRPDVEQTARIDRALSAAARCADAASSVSKSRRCPGRSLRPRRRPCRCDRRAPSPASLRTRPQLWHEVEPFPGEAAIGLGRAAEMAVGGGARIDRLVEAEMRADAARREIHQLLQHARQLLLVDLRGAVGVDIDRQRLGHADRIGELDACSVRPSPAATTFLAR